MRVIAIPTSTATRSNFSSSPVAFTRPELASPEEMSALHRMLRIKRVVIVTPSVYGTDNSATLYGMKARGADARGVAVIDDKTTESDLCYAMAARWHARHSAQSRDRRQLAIPTSAANVFRPRSTV